MKNLAFCLMIWLAMGCQQSNSSSNPEPEPETSKQESKIDSIQSAKVESKDKAELWYEHMIGEDFAASRFSTIEKQELSSSYLRGKVVFINFWYKNCPPCIAEMEGLRFLHEKFQREDIVFIMVTFEDLDVIQEIQNEYNLDYNMVSVEKDSISSWGVKGYPSSFVLDKTGKVVYARVGGHTEAQKATVEVLSHFGPEIEALLEL